MSNSVTVFWAFPDCPLPPTHSAHYFIKHIKSSIDEQLSVVLPKTIYLYTAMQSLPFEKRNEFNECGVQLMDVPTKGKDKSVTKRIIADIGLHVLDIILTDSKSVLVLISCDSDFGYILSRIKSNSCINKIMLCIPPNETTSLLIHADTSFSLYPKDFPFNSNQSNDIKNKNSDNILYDHNQRLDKSITNLENEFNRSNLHTCDLCQKNFVNINSLLDHKKTKHTPKSFPHELRVENFKTELNLSSHTNAIHHVNTSHPPRSTYKCEFCAKNFLTKVGLACHKNAKHSANIPNNNGDTLNDSLNNFSDNSKIKTKDHACLECGKSFYQKAGLDDHIKIKHFQNNIHRCVICQKGFENSKDLDAHIIHDHSSQNQNEKGFKCNHCDVLTMDTISFCEHIKRNHSNNIANGSNYTSKAKAPKILVKKFKCSKCEKCFGSIYDLDQHTLVKHLLKNSNNFNNYQDPNKFDNNQEIKPIQCIKCGECFESISNLIHHHENTHELKNNNI